MLIARMFPGAYRIVRRFRRVHSPQRLAFVESRLFTIPVDLDADGIRAFRIGRSYRTKWPDNKVSQDLAVGKASRKILISEATPAICAVNRHFGKVGCLDGISQD